MTYEEIQEIWLKDAEIDLTDLQGESAKSGLLHAKYHHMYWQEKHDLDRLLTDYKILKKQKEEFLLNPNLEDAQEHGWEIPDKVVDARKIGAYLESDKELLEFSLTISSHNEKVEYLKSILVELKDRKWIIKNINDAKRFLDGG